MALVEYTATKVVCDICGADANGSWFRREEVNGITNRLFISPIDLCDTHSKMYDEDEAFKKYVVLESEKNNYPQEKKDELIQAMKQKWEGMEEWQKDQMKNNH